MKSTDTPRYVRMAKFGDGSSEKLVGGTKEPLPPRNAATIEEQLSSLVHRNKMQRCPKCNAKVQSLARGAYKCLACNEVSYDEFGKVCKYLEEHGPSNKYEIAEATGIPESTVARFLREQRLEIAKIYSNMQ